MKKIKVTNYTVGEQNFEVKKSLIAILFHQMLNLSHLELFTNNKLAKKIEECTDEDVLLEDSEYQIFKKAVETIKGYNRESFELINRIINAETVEIQEKER